ncbi:hypothetical protein SAMN05216389_13812 [Oceanobacillus limi]|uniref:Haemolysin XhlA n=1 Tax=Oceanobacillus limi TaxID=930131 RepID=A0A1I0HKJ5_9BACI|nr:hypothetical protein [Oceanobacillus limi]SET84448.1 hypothetical protein SAMN05216389_13812 [Oceanobacillus limi]
MSDRDQWYTNKELFEQLNAMQGDFLDLRSEMKETRNVIKKYNGLREELGVMKEKLNRMEARTQGRLSVGEAIRNWGGWLFALITLVVLLVTKF